MIFNIAFLLIGIVGVVVLVAIANNQSTIARNQVKQAEILREILKKG